MAESLPAEKRIAEELHFFTDFVLLRVVNKITETGDFDERRM